MKKDGIESTTVGEIESFLMLHKDHHGLSAAVLFTCVLILELIRSGNGSGNGKRYQLGLQH